MSGIGMTDLTMHSVQGQIEISPLAIARIASHAVLQSYGIVGMAAPNLASDIAWTLTRDPNRGIEVHLSDEQITIDLYVIIEYGTRISTVAASVINAVRFSVEKATSLKVVQINVHVQGIRVSDNTRQ
jgi:uncharacterized alkaline shock family protein YloU